LKYQLIIGCPCLKIINLYYKGGAHTLKLSTYSVKGGAHALKHQIIVGGPHLKSSTYTVKGPCLKSSTYDFKVRAPYYKLIFQGVGTPFYSIHCKYLQGIAGTLRHRDSLLFLWGKHLQCRLMILA
jgi:hypothetical protein